jgi:hypothetical protein
VQIAPHFKNGVSHGLCFNTLDDDVHTNIVCNLDDFLKSLYFLNYDLYLLINSYQFLLH